VAKVSRLEITINSETPAGGQRCETGAGAGVSDYSENHPLGVVMCM
jgi:hypothetical protein